MTSPQHLRLLASVVLAPLLLMAAGWWLQFDARSKFDRLPPAANVDAQRDRLVQMKVDLESGKLMSIERQRPGSRGGDVFYGPAAVAELTRAIDQLESGDGELRARRRAYGWSQPLAQGAFVAGLVALAVGVSGVLLALGAGRWAMRSREALASTFDRTRRALPWLLAAMLAAITVACALLTAVVSLYFYETFTAARMAGGEGKLEVMMILLGVVVTGACALTLANVRRSFAVFQPEPVDQWGHALDESQAPGLWRLVRDTAASLGAQPPRHVVVGLIDGFYVTAASVRLLPEGRTLEGETMYLPLSLAALLRADELRSIVGHELAHFSGDDVRYSQRFVPLYAGIARTIDAAGADDSLLSPARAMGRLMLDRVHRAVAHWSRVREFAADQAGAGIASPRAAARALVRTHAVHHLTATYFDEVFRRPDLAPADIVAGLLEHVRRQGIAAPDLRAAVADAHPTDSHPPAAERVQALGVELSNDLVTLACAPCDDRGLAFLDALIVDRLGLQRRLSSELSSAAVQHRQAVTDELRAMVDEAMQPVELREHVTAMRTFAGIMAAVLLLAGLGLAFYAWTLEMPTLAAVAAGFGVVCLTGFGGLSMWWNRRHRTPVGTLTSTGLRSRSLRGELPWAAVDEINATVINGATVDVFFVLAPGASAPQLVDRNLRRFEWIARKRTLRVRMLKINGGTPRELLDLVDRYRRGAYAQRALAELAAPSALTHASAVPA